MCIMKISETVLTLAFLANCISRCPGFFFTKRKFSGQLKPMDPNVCATQNITFTTELLQSPLLNYSIGFAVKTRHTNSKYVVVDYDRIVEVNETMSQFTMYNIALETEEAKNPVYIYVRSYYWQEFGDTNGALQLGQTSTARVYPLPEEVQNFKCIVINYGSMNCSWTYGIDYGENMPEVIFHWRNPLYTASWTDCKDLNIKYGYCYWKDVTAGYFKMSNLTMMITLKQKCGGLNAFREVHIDTAKIVKPNPVSSISSKVINSTCIQLFWDTSDSEPQHTKEHRVIVSSEGDIVTTTFISTASGTERHNKIICNLHPYTEYTFSVSMQPIGYYSGYFSDERKSVSMTYSDIPSASPEVTEGGYNWNHRDCDEQNQKRYVCIFWKSIKKVHENGPMKGIQALFTTIDTKGLPVHEDWAADSTYGCFSLLCNSSYFFTLKARNVNGTSENGSTIKIPKFIPGNNPPKFIVESANTSNVYISLDNREKRKVKGFTVLWCRTENGNCESGRDIDWKHIDTHTKVVPIQINASSQDFLYGVSALTEEYGNSGVEWQDCVYLKNITPKREPQNVVVSAGSEDNTLDVTWDKLPCRADEPYIAMYNVRYNKLNQGNKKSIDVTESGEARMVLQDLEEDQTYVVTVRGITKDGRPGPESQPQKGVPINKSLKPTEIAGISMAALVGAMFAGVGLFCIVRICKKKAKKIIEEAGHITIPDFPDLENVTELKSQNSSDSGYDLTPPPEKVSSGTNLGFVRPDDYRYATIDHGKTINDNDESRIDSGETTKGNGDIKLTTTEEYVPEPEQKHLTTNQPDISVLPTVTSQNTGESILMHVIPKPVAFNKKEAESGMSYSDEENKITTDSSNDKLVDYIKCKNAYSDSIDKQQNALQTKGTMINNDSETNVEVDDNDSRQLNHQKHQANHDSPFHLSNAQSLINIPCPNEIGISNDAFDDNDKEISLTHGSNKCQQSRHIASSLSSDINSEIEYTKDYIPHSNVVQESVAPGFNTVQDSLVSHSNAVQDYVVSHSNAVQGNVTPHSNTVQKIAILHSNTDQKTIVLHSNAVQDNIAAHSYFDQNKIIIHSYADQDNIVPHANAVQDNIAPESNAVQGNVVPHSNVAQNNVCCNTSFSNITNISNKDNGCVTQANIIAACMPSYAVQIYVPNGKMETSVDHGSHIDSHTVPITCTFHKNVDPGYVFATKGNGFCKDRVNKIPLDVGYVEQQNTTLKNMDDKDIVSFQGYVDDRFITSLQAETLNVAKSADIDGETSKIIDVYL